MDDALLLLAHRALGHAVDSAVIGESFMPFLWWHDPTLGGWHALPFMSGNVGEAEATARCKARSLPPTVDAVAYVFDGYTVTDEGRYDTAYCRVSLRNPARSLLVAQPYEAGARGGFPVGTQRTEWSDAWFA